MKKFINIMIIVLLVTSCSLKDQANAEFGDQNFKSAIAFIELHKVRTGDYPKTLNDLQFLGSWDLGWVNSVEYEKDGDGYILNLKNGWDGMPGNLKYPDAFWKGLGIKKSNMMNKLYSK